MKLCVVFLICALSAVTNAQEQTRTKLEQSLSSKSHLLTKDFYSLGTVGGIGSSLEFDALVVTDAANDKLRIKGIRVQVTERGPVERTNTSFLDADEVDDFSKALAYMLVQAEKWKASPPVEKYAGGGTLLPPPYREVAFTSRGDFVVTVYQRGTQEGAVIQSGAVGRTTAALPAPDLSKVKSIVDTGAALLKTQ